MKNILYIGESQSISTSKHRADALVRIGHNVIIANPYTLLRGNIFSRWMSLAFFHLGYYLFQPIALFWIHQLIRKNIGWPDIVWVNADIFGRRAVKNLRRFGCPIILYSIDDPTGTRDADKCPYPS